MPKKHKLKKKTKKDFKSRRFVYKPLKEEDRPPRPESDYDEEAYEFFQSVKWDNAWKEYLSLDKEGKFKHRTAWSFCKFLVGGEDKKYREQAKWIYAAIGPMDKKNRKPIVPYVGDWSFMRTSLFIGETNKESLLFGNPRIAAVREIVKKHVDVMEISQGIGEVMMGWLGRFDAWSTQVDEHFQYKLFDPRLNEEKNERRFKSYTKMQEYLFSRTIDSTRQVLKCFGVGENDVGLLTQMMIASMKDRLGEGTARMMMAAASGLKVIDSGASQPEMNNDRAVIDGSHEALMKNKQLSTMFGTFLQKSQMYKIPHPGIDIDGVPPEEDTKVIKTNGKSNGKAHRTQ